MEKPQPPSNMNWAYVAGFFDGEGDLGMCPRFCLTITQKNHQVLLEILAFFQHQGIKGGGIYKNTNGTHRINLGGSGDVMIVLRGMLLYLRVKKVIAQDTLRYTKLYPPLRTGTTAHTMLMKESLGYAR